MGKSISRRKVVAARAAGDEESARGRLLSAATHLFCKNGINATGIDAMATSRLVLDALQTLGMKKVVLLTPYMSNKAVIDYLTAAGVTVLRDVAMKLEAKDFGSVTPADWARMAKEIDGPDADGVFLSCTNTTQIEAIAEIERTLGKPVVNSNQAVLWGCVRRLRGSLPKLAPMPELGRLMGHLN